MGMNRPKVRKTENWLIDERSRRESPIFPIGLRVFIQGDFKKKELMPNPADDLQR